MHDPGPAFRALHVPGSPFILANAWDRGSARLLAALGAQGLGTTSAGFAFTLGLPDGARITRDEALAHAASLVTATPLPVSADLENGYAEAPEGVAETVRLAEEAGLAGLSIEDTNLPGEAAYPFDLAVERIRAAAAQARALPRDLVLVARADGVMTGAYDLAEGIRRLQAFEAAGADCLYLPMPASLEEVALICRSVSRPVNALAAGPFAHHTRAEFAQAGVARISLGSALARATHRVILEAAGAMFGEGSFALLQGPEGGSAAVDSLLRRGAGEGAGA
jgi:2-methylisocitrate lyase-like PEP mutase family enzyme